MDLTKISDDYLKNLSEEEKKVVFSILKEYSEKGYSKEYNELLYSDYDEVPVNIETFLHDKQYLGNALYDQEGRFTVFPYWEEKLKEIFPTNIETKYNTMILTGCLAYDTEISLLNGKNVKIGDLAKQGDLDEYVYSYDVETNSYVPGHLVAAFSTGKKPVYNITLDNGTIIKATANHQFMTRDKHWKSIETGLTIGDSMMPFNRKLGTIANRNGYEIIENPNNDGTTTDIFTHRLVMNWKRGDYKGVVHHIDFNKNNNDPRNLVLTDWMTHKMYHTKRGGDRWREFNKKRANKEIPQELEQQIRDGALKGCLNRWSKETEHQKMSDLTTSRMNDGLAKEMSYTVWNGKNAEINRQRSSATITAANKDKNKIKQYQISKAIKISSIALVEFGELTETTYEKVKLLHNMRIGYPSFKSILKRITFDELLAQAQTYNHKILKIEYAGEEEVYDLTVEKYHNFAINNGIVAHNSIGIGKSTTAVICLLYLLYRLLCLKDPYLYYGLQPIDKITISLMNITIENAKGVALDKMNQMIMSSSWFMAHGKMTGVSNLVYVPDKHIELITASSNNQVIGRAVFCLDGDTIILTTDGEKKLKEVVNKNISVYSIDNKGKLIISDTCSVKPTITTNEEYEIELEDGSIIKCTPNHKFMLKDGSYKEAQYLTEEDELFDYKISYRDYIDSIINTRGQWNIPEDEYFEVHHIIPKCLGGTGKIRKGRKIQKHPNLIYLYPHEHFIAHKLLALENPNNTKLVYAWSMMAFPKGKTNRDFQITPEEYSELKTLQSELSSKNNNFLKNGKPWNKGLTKDTDERIMKQSKNSKGLNTWTQGINRSQNTRDKISKAVKKRYKEHPETFKGRNKNKVAINNGYKCYYIDKEDMIPTGYVYGQGKHKTYKIKDYETFCKNHSEYVKGKNNGMYKKGYKIAGGNNGKAKYIYIYKDKEYQCRDDLMKDLKFDYKNISECTIRKIMNNDYTDKLTKKYPGLIENLSWKLKDKYK